MRILIGLIPALLWGIMPISIQKCGGKPIHQLLGTIYGAVVLGLIVIFTVRPPITKSIFIWNFIAGLCWAIGQITQFNAFREIGVSMTAPITTGIQLALVSIIGVTFFGSWTTGVAKILGFIAIIIDVIGVVLTAVHDKDTNGKGISSKDFRLGMTNTLGGTMGLVGYNVLPKIPNASGWQMFFPQTLGMLLMAIIMALIFKNYRTSKPFFNKFTLKNIITGLIFGGACCGFLFSIKLNGLSTGFTLSQMCVAIATVSGIVILHEHKSHRELKYTLSGLCLILIGTVIVGTLQ